MGVFIVFYWRKERKTLRLYCWASDKILINTLLSSRKKGIKCDFYIKSLLCVSPDTYMFMYLSRNWQ